MVSSLLQVVAIEEQPSTAQFSVVLLNKPSSREERMFPTTEFNYPITFSSRSFYSVSPSG